MKIVNQTLLLSAGDLSHHMACKHLTTLNQAAALGTLEMPKPRDPSLAALQKRGLELEQYYLKAFQERGLTLSIPADKEEESSLNRTINAMKAGIDIIYQASLQLNEWQGRADFLQKITKPSNLGNWSYEVIDAKLATQTRVGTIVQLCLYSEMVGAIQGLMLEYMYVVTPGESDSSNTYRLDDFMAYYRYIKKQLNNATVQYINPDTTYPIPCSFCDICNWWERCNTRRRQDDDLTFVAGLATGHLSELALHKVVTMEALAQLPVPIPFKPQRGAVETFERLREQARLQVQARTSKEEVYELIQIAEGRGFFKLPTPSPGDIFFDFEGDPFIRDGGMEYLFGWVPADQPEVYHKLWALDHKQEKIAFETFVDIVMERWRNHSGMHIYHFAAYEPTAIKRLMGRYATRENEVDQMLRAGLFVDLHTVTRQALRAGVETYSLKELEKFHAFERAQELKIAAEQLREVQRKIEAKQTILSEETVKVVENYNQEDCLSTRQLRDWLEALRDKLEQDGHAIPRPTPGDGSPSESLNDYQQRIARLIELLLEGIPYDATERTPQQQAVWLLANMLDWYRREKKATWWELFRLRDLSPLEMMEEKVGIGGLRFTGHRVDVKRSVIDEYEFPAQDFEIRYGDDVYITVEGKKIGTIESVSDTEYRIQIKKGPTTKDIHPISIFSMSIIPNEAKEQSIERLADWVLQNGIDSIGNFRAGRDLLINLPPRIIGELPVTTDPQRKAVYWCNQLENGVLPIQGPPGTGKSHTGAEMILSQIRAGKKVGITALSHKVIIGLMTKVLDLAIQTNITVRAMRKVSQPSTIPDPRITEITKNELIVGALQSGKANLVGGTAWLWSRPDMAAIVDVLFVDEAGQLSLIDTVAVAQATTNLVLLGDPQQLQQPQQGSHPDGTEVSALHHILKEHQTIPDNKEIFLETTWRMHPSICSFISELFYESRLGPKADLINQRLDGDAEFDGAGLYFRAVDHEGNQSSSQQEAAYVRDLIVRLTNGKVTYADKDKQTRVLTIEDIKVITPYNAQLNLLSNMLPTGIQIGTVDKFQGQEAPVIIFSMATSTPADAPRGMEFLYSSNRFNVAVSRARATFILVASPKLFEPDCKNVEQMKLANAFSRFLEVAK